MFTTTSSTTPTQSDSIISTVSSTLSSQVTSTETSTDRKKTAPTYTKVGIGVGIPGEVLLLAGVGVIVWMVRKHSRKQTYVGSVQEETRNKKVAELPSSIPYIGELEGSELLELDGTSTPRVPIST
jgi:hypothetical protein